MPIVIETVPKELGDGAADTDRWVATSPRRSPGALRHDRSTCSQTSNRTRLPPKPRALSLMERAPQFVIYALHGPYTLYLMLRYRGIMLPTAANPGLEGSGLTNESKAGLFDLLGPVGRAHLAPFVTIRTGPPHAGRGQARDGDGGPFLSGRGQAGHRQARIRRQDGAERAGARRASRQVSRRRAPPHPALCGGAGRGGPCSTCACRRRTRDASSPSPSSISPK